MEKLFLDTSGLLAVFDHSDSHHDDFRTFWQTLRQSWSPVTSDYILDELATRVRKRVNHFSALRALDGLLTLVQTGQLSLVWVNQTHFATAQSIFQRYDDKEFSFTDCTSFAICDSVNIGHAFAIDRDFRDYGITLHP